MKAALAGVLAGLQGLGSDDSRERPVDRLAALAAIQMARGAHTAHEAALCALGVRLISFKFANCPASKADAEDMLTALLVGQKIGIGHRRAKKVAIQALFEFALDMCPTCLGAGEVPDIRAKEGAQPMKVCPDCGGRGKRRYTDHERIAAMGAAMDKAMSEAHGLIGQAESLAVRQAKEMLERW